MKRAILEFLGRTSLTVKNHGLGTNCSFMVFALLRFWNLEK